ncbi:MAG: ATP-binding cassette domain-containing protein [Deltaproteobacteria bacterium]
MIEARALQKRFGKVEAVADVSFRAGDGVVTGLLGPNGAGKTTTLRMLTGLLEPDGGEALVDGVQVQREPMAARRRMGILSDAKGLYPRLTAREHVRYFGELHGLEGPRLEERIGAMLELLDMREIADRRAEGFSTGERTKVALARALVHEPGNVLLDEPTNGLDVMSTRAVRGLIQRLRAQGRCVVFSSHVMQEVAQLCDRIIVVARGRIVADGTPADLRARTGKENLEEAFVSVIGSDSGLDR